MASSPPYFQPPWLYLTVTVAQLSKWWSVYCDWQPMNSVAVIRGWVMVCHG